MSSRSRWSRRPAQASRRCSTSLITNPTGWDRFKAKMRNAVIGFFQRRIERKLQAA